MKPITYAFLFLTIAIGPLMRVHPVFDDASMNVVAIKTAGIAVLALSHHIGVALHPFIGTHTWGEVFNHLVGTLSCAYVLNERDYAVGYPVLATAPLLHAFLIPCAIFTAYLVLGASLVRNGWSRQWANLAFLASLLIGDMHPWHPNPLITVVSVFTYGYRNVYVLHLLAIAVAVLTANRINKRFAPSPKITYALSHGAVMRLIGALRGHNARMARSPKKK
jgi:hypothetical protein